MAQSYLVFDFGSNEEAAEQARRTIDRWKQAFRLDKKVMMKFERQKSEDDVELAGEDTGDDTVSETEPEARKVGRNADKKPAGKTAEKVARKDRKKVGGEETDGPEEQIEERITLIVRLEFSDHEKLSHRRWLARIPIEEPFKNAQPKTVEHGDPEFAAVMERFQGGTGRAHGFSGSSGTP